MNNNLAFPDINYLRNITHLFTEPVGFFHTVWFSPLFLKSEEPQEKAVPPVGEIPVPDEGGIFPNRQLQQEEEYLPDEEEAVIEEPEKDVPDPYFPEKEDGLPPYRQEEFPQTDPK